jgi:hypothetical protein
LKNKIIAIAILALLFLTVTFSAKTEKAYGWGPCTHIYFTERALKIAGNTTLTNIIYKNKDWFMCGMMYPDVTVIYYYTEWKSYRATHAWTFQDELWRQAQDSNDDRAKAFALGVAVHLLQDSITHNFWIPEKIRGTFVQNNIIHPLSEGLLETRLISEDPLTQAMSIHSFELWNRPFDGCKYFYRDWKGGYLSPVEWADEVLGRTAQDSFTDEASTFNTILSGGEFYTKGYVIPQAGGWWSIYRGFSDFIRPLVSTKDADKYINQTISATVDFFRYGRGDDPEAFIGQYDPTGYDALKAADNYVVTWTIAIVIIVIAILAVWYRRKAKKE